MQRKESVFIGVGSWRGWVNPHMSTADVHSDRKVVLDIGESSGCSITAGMTFELGVIRFVPDVRELARRSVYKKRVGLRLAEPAVKLPRSDGLEIACENHQLRN